MTTTKSKTDASEALKQLTYLATALKAPRITEAAGRLADHARDAGWTHEEYLAAVLDREVAARNASGAQLRIRAAGFAARKTIEEFDWDVQPAVRQQIAALASGGFLTEARNVTAGQVSRLVKKEKITQEQADAQVEEIVGRIYGTTTYDGFGDVDLVIEAVPERMEIKKAVFAELDAVTPGRAILASNTSSLSLTEIGESILRPDKVIGFHYFYPAAVMPLIEIVRGDVSNVIGLPVGLLLRIAPELVAPP